MKINDLKQMIRQIVKEEVANEVNKAMGKVLVEMIKESRRSTKPTKPTAAESIEEEEEQKAVSTAAIIKTNNPKLNAILAETARNFVPLKKADDSDDLVGLASDFDKIGQNENVRVTNRPETKVEYLKQLVNESAVPAQRSVLDGGSQVPDILKNVFKKDFRAVMRAIDEKKKTGGSGMINPSQILSG